MAKLIEGQTFNNKEKSITEADHDVLTIRNCTINITELNPASKTAITGLDIRRCGEVNIENVTIKAVGLQRKYAYALRAGYSNNGVPVDGNKIIKISNCNWSGFGPLNAGYNLNRDIMALEAGDEVWIKDSILGDSTDAIGDCKIPIIKVARTKSISGYRQWRRWGNGTTTLADCEFDTKGEHFWFQTANGKIVLFNPKFAQPMKTSFDQAMGVIQNVTTNPLTDPWFSSSAPVPQPDYEARIKALEDSYDVIHDVCVDLNDRLVSIEDWAKSIGFKG